MSDEPLAPAERGDYWDDHYQRIGAEHVSWYQPRLQMSLQLIDARGVAGLSARAYGEESVFTAANLLREARRQRHLPDVPVPAVCLLDPDGDVVRHLAATGGRPDATPPGPATTLNCG